MRMTLNEKIREDVHAAEWKKTIREDTHAAE